MQATHFTYQRKNKAFGTWFAPVRKISELQDPMIQSLIRQGLIVAVTKVKLKEPQVEISKENEILKLPAVQ